MHEDCKDWKPDGKRGLSHCYETDDRDDVYVYRHPGVVSAHRASDGFLVFPCGSKGGNWYKEIAKEDFQFYALVVSREEDPPNDRPKGIPILWVSGWDPDNVGKASRNWTIVNFRKMV